MIDISSKFPEIKSSHSPAEIPWKDALVWVNEEEGRDKYYWLMSEEILYVSWTGGFLSVIPASHSLLSSYFQALLIKAKNVFVGINVKSGN